MFEISKQFKFDAAHTLSRRIDAEASRRIHGHSYRAEVTIRGEPNAESGMIVDFGVLERMLEEVRGGLDHRFLDELNDLGPATLENLSVWIWRRVKPAVGGLTRVTVFRDSHGDSCSYYGPSADQTS